MTASLFRDLVAFSIQIALVVLAVAVLVKVVRLPARVRYVGLRLVLVASLMLPWLLRSPQTPPVPEPAITQSGATVTFIPSQMLPTTPTERAVAPAGRGLVIPWIPLLFGALIVGVVGRSLWLAVGLMRLRRMTRGAAVVEDPEYAELQAQLGTRATIAQVSGLSQPATFGVLRPIVMLPDALAAAPAPMRRAVIIHELFHVRRRDWLFLLAEEIVRTALWFHPAILWLTSHIQLAREEIVDELTVRATGDRRSYMQALLTFADSGGLSPAPAFAHRRQLFHRILSVSKETVMSRPRIVTSTAALVAVVCGASWYASSLFPIVKADAPSVAVTERSRNSARAAISVEPPAAARLQGAAAVPGAAPAQGAVVMLDQRTGAVITPRQVTPENPIPRRTRGTSPAWPSQFAGRRFHVLVQSLVTIDRNGGVIVVERGGCQVFERPAAGEPNDAVCRAFAEAGDSAVRQWRYDRPAQAPLQFTVLSTFVPGSEPTVTQAGSDLQRYLRETPESERALSDRQAPAAGTRDFLAAELAQATNTYRELERAYRIASESHNPAHPDVMRLQSQLASANDQMAALQEKLRMAERAYAQEQLRGAQQQSEPPRDAQAKAAEQPAAGSRPLISPSGKPPVRVGGAVTSPKVIKRSTPVYSAEAMQARVEGNVVLEALIDEQGRVADARVIGSNPLLDESALAAAKQWEFTPTLLNGEPVPVLVMIELSFTLRK